MDFEKLNKQAQEAKYLIAKEKGEKVLDSQIRIFHIIKEKYNELFETCKTKIFEYVNDDEQKNLFPDNQIPENIFKFIMPKAIVITRDIDVDYFGILFHFRYDPENDICVSFKNFNFYFPGELIPRKSVF